MEEFFLTLGASIIGGAIGTVLGNVITYYIAKKFF